jgi:hypothetical protein
VCCSLSITVNAGSQQDTEAKFAPQAIAAFAKGVERYAARQGARAFVIARVGRAPADLPRGIKYTHTAIAVYSTITLDDGSEVNAYAIHNLYQNADNLKRSELIIDYPVDFFWGAHELRAGILIPNAELQQALIELISKRDHVKLHNPQYSVIASPYNSMYQNCTEHILDMINAAIYGSTNLEQLKANTIAHFKAQAIHASRFKLALGSMFMKDITTRDHKGKVSTASFLSIARYLQQYDLAKHVIALDDALNATPL